MTHTADDVLARLHRAILVDPHDDDLRLVYADRLEEMGEVARAEFVRVQAQMWILCNGTDGPFNVPNPHYNQLNPLMHRATELLRQHYCAWIPEWLCPIESGGVTHQSRATMTWARSLQSIVLPYSIFRRGFIGEVHCAKAAWHKHGAAVCAEHPVTRLTLTDAEPHATVDVQTIVRHYWWIPESHVLASLRAVSASTVPDGWASALGDGKRFATPADAKSALNVTALNVARVTNDLPPLERTP